MYYFFQKDEQHLQCEIRTADAPETFAIIVTEPNGHERSQYLTSAVEVTRAWEKLREDLLAAGWWGTAGRD